MNWQPIETAPKDGVRVLLLDTEGRMEVGSWHAKGTSWVGDTLQVTGVWDAAGGWFQPDEVTHWMPLPEPPK